MPRCRSLGKRCRGEACPVDAGRLPERPREPRRATGAHGPRRESSAVGYRVALAMSRSDQLAHHGVRHLPGLPCRQQPFCVAAREVGVPLRRGPRGHEQAAHVRARGSCAAPCGAGVARHGRHGRARVQLPSSASDRQHRGDDRAGRASTLRPVRTLLVGAISSVQVPARVVPQVNVAGRLACLAPACSARMGPCAAPVSASRADW